MSLVDDILGQPELVESPPVLVDVGASGPVHQKWKAIAPYSVCVAFEGYAAEVPAGGGSTFRTLHLRPAIVAERALQEQPFYLTRFPFCSSRLRPDERGLRRYAFASLFEVESVEQVGTLALPEVLAELGIERVDWFKTDSQGTDLRLLASLGDDAISRILVAELEPGIIDAYEGEDKLADVMAFMGERSFWMSDLNVQGTQRISAGVLDAELGPAERRLARAAIKRAPCWAEAEYFSDFESDSLFGKRELMLGCLFALVRGHEGFALELSLRARLRFDEELFERLETAARRAIRRRYARLPLAALRSLGRS